MKLTTKKQFAITAFLIVMAQKMFLLPAIMIKTGGQSSYLSMLIMILIEMAVLALFMMSIRLAPTRSFYNLLDKGAGKIGGRVIAAVMMVAMTIKCILLISEIRVFFNINLNESLVDWAAVIPICVFLFIVATKTLRGVGRLAEITFPLVTLSMLALFTFVAGNINTRWLLPVMGDGIKPVLNNIYLFPIWFADIPYMFVFLGKVKDEKKIMPFGFIGITLGAVIVLFFTTVIFMTYGDIPDLLDYGNNISNMLLYSSANYTYGRFDILIFSVWLFTIFIQLALVFYGITRNLKYIVSAKDNRLVALAAVIALYVLAVFVFHDEHKLSNFGITGFVRVFAFFNLAFVPVYAFVTALVLRRRADKNKGRLTCLRPVYDKGLRAGRIKNYEV